MKNWLEQAFEDNPDKIAVIFEDQEITYRTLRDNSRDMAHLLRNQGVTRRSNVAISLDSCLEYVYCIYALIYLDCIMIPVNRRLEKKEIASQLIHADATHLITELDWEFEGINKVSPFGENGK